MPHDQIQVIIPSLLRSLVNGSESLCVPFAPGQRISVHKLLEGLDSEYPGLLAGLLYRGDLLPGIAVFIDNEHALMGLRAQVQAGSVVQFVPPVVGGSFSRSVESQCNARRSKRASCRRIP